MEGPDSISDNTILSLASSEGYSSDDSSRSGSTSPEVEYPKSLNTTGSPDTCRKGRRKHRHSGPLASRRCSSPGSQSPPPTNARKEKACTSKTGGAKGCRLGAERHRRRSVDFTPAKDSSDKSAGDLTFKAWGAGESGAHSWNLVRPQKHGNITMKVWGGDVPEDAAFIADTVKRGGEPGEATIKMWGGCVPPDELFEIRNAGCRVPRCSETTPKPTTGWRSSVEGSKDVWAAAELEEEAS